MFKNLNIWGCGYVNINDVPQYRHILSGDDPYININSFIDLNFPKAKKWRKINPPANLISNKQNIIKELLTLEEKTSSRCKMISYDSLSRIIGHALTEEHRLFI